jgi:hypothetical protein
MPRTLRVSESAGSKLGRSDHATQHELNWAGEAELTDLNEAPTPAYRAFQPDLLSVPSVQSTLAKELKSDADGVAFSKSPEISEGSPSKVVVHLPFDLFFAQLGHV